MSLEAKVLAEVDKLKPELVRFAQDLIRVPSINPPGDEREVAEIMRGRLASLGLEVKLVSPTEKRVNILSVLKSSGQGHSLLFNGHMDAVPISDASAWTVEPFGGLVKGNRLYGRGSSDMKGALASITTAIRAIVDSGLHLKGDLVFHAVADEEAGSDFGTKYVVKNGLVNASMAVVAEGSVFDGKIFLRPAVRGACWIRLETSGKASHASQPRGGVNAVLSMARLLLALKDLKLEHKPHRFLPPPTISPGTVVQGGIKVNVIPDRCIAEVDIRMVPGMESEAVLQQVRAVMEKLTSEDRDFRAKVTLLSSSKPAEISIDSDVVRLAREAAGAVAGYEPEFRGGYGSNDSTYLINEAGIPTICGFGPGDHETGNAHGPDENVSIEELVNFAKIYALMALRACGTGN